MSNLKEIRRRITSVGNTKQITRAMKLVSAAKLKRAQDAATGGRDFSRRLDKILSDLTSRLPEDYSHPLLPGGDSAGTTKKTGKKRLIVVSGDRGLCGPYNTNVQKAVEKEIERAGEEGVEIEVIAIGRRAVTSGTSCGWNILQSYESLSSDPNEWPVAGIVAGCAEDFEEAKVDEVALVYTHFHSAVNQEVKMLGLMPFESSNATASGIDASEQDETSEQTGKKVKCDPDPESIVSELVNVLISSRLTQSVLESRASEHAARMTAMDAATNNANDLIGKLKLTYNRARQSAITTELIDIVGGAEATGS